MIGEKRAREIFDKTVYKMQRLASIPSTAPLNQRIQLRAYCIIWELKQKYRGEGSPSYMTKRAHKEALDGIIALRNTITPDLYKTEATEAVQEAEEYLSILSYNLIRDNRKNRVY